MTLPNFLIIGAAKAGTTSLWHAVQQHPQVYMSSVKEPHFFAFENEKPVFRGPGDEEIMNRELTTDIESYCSQFKKATDEQAIGEASTTYLYIPKAPKRIQHYIPHAKLIAILRDPVERAYSSFLHKVREGLEPLTDFTQALRAEEERISKNWESLWHYKRRGYYYIQLRRYYDLFDRDQVRVYTYDDFNDNPIGISQDIFRFLDIDDTFRPDILRRQATGIQRSTSLNRLIIGLRQFRPVIEEHFPEKLSRSLFRIGLELKNRNLTKPRLQGEMRRQLVQEYEEDILKLQDLIQKDLTKWLKQR